MAKEKIIGIVGGVGPYAGLDLCKKVFDQTTAVSDQQHLSTILVSMPGCIDDRTDYLIGRTVENPGHAIFEIIKKLHDLGAEVIGIPCNTSHAPPIFDVIVDGLRESGLRIKLLHMIDEVAVFIKEFYTLVSRVGVLSTTGTYRTGVYKDVLENHGLEVILPEEDMQENMVHKSIYDSEYGIKARSNPVMQLARAQVAESIKHLGNMGAEVVILGCTELSLAVESSNMGGIPLIDSSLVLARALVREAAPGKLKEFINR